MVKPSVWLVVSLNFYAGKIRQAVIRIGNYLDALFLLIPFPVTLICPERTKCLQKPYV